MAEPLYLSLILHENNREELSELVANASDPAHPSFGKYLTRDELAKLVALDPKHVADVRKWLVQCGMEIIEDIPLGGQAMVLRATEEQIQTSFGKHLANWLQNPSGHRSPRVDTAVPLELAGLIQAVHGIRNGPSIRSSMVDTVKPGDSSASDTLPYSRRSENDGPPPGFGGVTPADIRRIYNFPPRWNGSGQTIALLMMGGNIDAADLRMFWRANGIEPPEVRIVRLGPQIDRPHNPLHQLEATMTVEWVGAMAPGATIVVYMIDPEIFADPWAVYLLALINDKENNPTVASTSWIIPERRYYRVFGNSVVTGLLDQAAALGITVISAAGDWGAFDGVPRKTVDGYAVSDAPWPHTVFPAVEERVLGVGGTMVTSLNPLTELAWSGPPPLAVAQAVQFTQLAGSGGFSQDVPIPKWQQAHLRTWYSRGPNQPAVVPYGRGVPDVALMAAGPAVMRENVLSALGYQAVVGRQWIDFAGGTSMAAPIWAATIALANQARKASGKGVLGFVNPLLYSIRKATPNPFRDILIGQTDVCVRVVNSHGKAVTFRLDGFTACPDWDPVTGLGVPHVTNLMQHLVAAGNVK